MADGYLNFDTKINESGFNEGINKLGSLGKSGLSVVSKAMTGAVAAVGAGAAAIVKSSLGVVANMEQQVGGVETLFKDSAKTVIRNANNAFKTAQLSANDYMSTVTSFSASLLQGLGGDTAKAAEIADMAIIDMADNANKMGTNMQDIQNAYQGFAKQNYTMLDNLKLGYGGTQSEMIRLINDSGILNEKIEDLDNVTFDQMIQAIHKVQQNLGITGTSAKEASTTIEGSVNSAKAAWENFEAGVISVNDLVDTFWTAAKNILNNLGQMIPRLGKTGMDVVESLSGKIGEAVPQLKGFTDSVGKLADKLQNMSTDELMNLGKTAAVLAGLISSGATLILGLMNAITANLPSLISVGAGIIATLVSSLGAQLPQLIPVAVQMILTLVESLISNLPQLITSGLQLMEGLAQGIANAIPQVAAKAPVIIGKLASTIITNLPKIIQTGVKIITQLAVGLVQGIPALLGKIPSMISQIKNAFTSVNWGSVGMNIISGIASGISSAVGSLISAATSAASSALDAIKSKLGIHSPSRVFRDQVGKMMALGMGIGFEKNIPVGSMNAGVQKAVQSLQRSVQLTTSVNPDRTVGGIKNNPIFKDQGFDYDRFERIQRKIAKENGNKPVFLDTKRIDRPLPKGAVPQV